MERAAGIHAVIIIFDLQSRASYDSVPAWYDRIPGPLGEIIPIVLCGNKADISYSRLGPEAIRFNREKSLRYYDISAKKGYNLASLFSRLARRLLDDHTSLDKPFIPSGSNDHGDDNAIATAAGKEGSVQGKNGPDVGFSGEDTIRSAELSKLLSTAHQRLII